MPVPTAATPGMRAVSFCLMAFRLAISAVRSQAVRSAIIGNTESSLAGSRATCNGLGRKAVAQRSARLLPVLSPRRKTLTHLQLYGHAPASRSTPCYLYGTAGGAWTNASTNVNASGSGASAGLNLSASKVGWTAGVGVEFALVDNWTAKVEYLYIDTGTISGTATVPASLGGGSLTETAAIRDNVFRIGVNYRFSFAPWPFTRY